MFSEKYIENVYSESGFKLAYNSKVADIYVSNNDYKGVIRAVKTFCEDVNKVTNILPEIKNDINSVSKNTVIIGTIGKSDIVDELIKKGKLDAYKTKGKWESFVIQVVQNPIEGIEETLVIAGSDKRGTIFGIYDVSEQIGVSPWYWWADVPVIHKDTLIVKKGIYKQGEPSVKYRGIFFNDEGPSLMSWVRDNYKDFTHEFYEKVFELILRLKGNYLWPAMWDNAFNEDDELNPILADEYGIVMGTSHHEPMLRAHGEWKKHKKGPWDYYLNEDYIYKFWEFGIERNKNYESIITLGMRGDGDEPMGGRLTFNEKIKLLEKIVKDQRKIIAEKMNSDVTKVPQLWALYKEVQDYYEAGMRVPEDITLLWSDDNHGNLRRVPTEEERKRKGGAGIYYHLDYVGGPRSYKWINTVPIEKIWEQMNKAYEYGADRIWILNVGDLKPMEFPTEYFMRMAWNINEFTKDNMWEFSVKWAEAQFGEKYAKDIAYIINQYSKFNGRLKPELFNNVELYSLINYKEAEKVLSDFYYINSKAEKIYKELKENLKDAFFELVLYPVKASLQVNELYLTVEKNKLYADQGRAFTNDLADKAEAIFEADDELTFDYNKRLAFGKWNHMMDQTHIGYTYWNQPLKNIMPEVKRIILEKGSEMGVAVEGSKESFSYTDKKCKLPQFDVFTREIRYIDIFNKKSDAFSFKIETDARWINVSLNKGIIEKEERVWVDIDWDLVPKGDNVKGNIIITSSCGNKVIVELEVFNPKDLDRKSLDGFIETNGYISIEAEHYTNKVNVNGISWKKIPNYGRTLSSMAIFPFVTSSVVPPNNSPCLEYKLYIVNPGNVKVTALLAPSLDFVEGNGLKIGISFDDGDIKIIDAITTEKDGSFCEKDWAESVIYNIRKAETNYHIEGRGYHTLKIWMVDPIVVLQKILVDMGGLKPSYLGPPESYYGGKKTENESLNISNYKSVYDYNKKEIIVLKPTLRLKNELLDEPLVLQLGVFNRSEYSHSFVINASLFDEKENIIDSISFTDIIPRNSKEMYNYCFKIDKNSKYYILKAKLKYEKINKELNFKIKSPIV
ncbi:Glycosyl hydrolase family 115 [Clostridium sp. USBA 49]|uniref:glycosyl hydrolase 115 family protein n=1 Tax=Clostridium sp. USBA 49 TaxID=1881060 RepID=UPI00099AB12E|nr:glycosyl hydrolase 115 family protein [Clostridium sp. USBA 49]SKA74262.1 Glycosyl hydrolase family 115 [Clostridium sp. USBA 49]